MNVKSLLCAAALLSVGSVAQAFTDYTITPTPGSKLNSNQSLATFNVEFAGATINIADNASATLMNEDGDEVGSSAFFEFQALPGTVIINFDESEIQMNGEWSFTIPAGSITVNGEENPKISATYSLDDPNLGLGEFPHITLESINPAADSKLAAWGGENFSRVDLKTSDDAAVNYIDWTLWDVTNGEGEGVREYLRQGEDNRIDPNRYGGSTDDIWANGLYITLSSLPEKLIEGRKYRLDLRFCGIGCTMKNGLPEYASPEQKDRSVELETAVYYFGLSEAPEYSEYEYMSVSPDPNEYTITSPEFAVFVITYSGPVMPVAFKYSIGMGAGTANVGKWVAADDVEVDSDGCAIAWKFIFDASVVNGATGAIATTVQTIDKDGLYVKGNGGYVFDDYNYSMEWLCNCGAPALISVEPADGAEVETLSSITISNERGLPMSLSYNAESRPQISDRSRAVVRELGEPEISKDGTQATWTFDPITNSDTYSLYVPDKYFVIGEQFDSYISNATTFSYVVADNNTPGEVTYDLTPDYFEPANDSEITSFSILHIVFDDTTFTPMNGTAPAVKLLKDGEAFQEVDPYDMEKFLVNDFFNPSVYDIMFDEVSEPGSYEVVLPQGLFCDEAYDVSEGKEGHANPEIVINFTIKGEVAGNVSYTLEPVEISPENNSNVEEIATVTLTFGEETYAAQIMHGFSVEMIPAELYKLDGTEETLLQSVEAFDNPASDFFAPTIYDFNFSAVAEKGQYKVVVPQGAFGTEEYQESNFKNGKANPEIVLYYTIGGNVGVDAIVGNAEFINVYDMNGALILNNCKVEAAKELNPGLYIINGKKVMICR